MFRIKNKVYKYIIGGKEILLSILLLVLIISAGFFYISDKILPNVFVGTTNLSLKNRSQSQELLIQNYIIPENINLFIGEHRFELSLSDIEASINFQETIDRAFDSKRGDNLFGINFSGLFNKKELDPSIKLDQNKLLEYLNVVSSETEIDEVLPTLIYEEDSVTVRNGQIGESVDKEGFIKLLRFRLVTQDFSDITVPILITDAKLTDNEIIDFQARGEKILKKSIVLELDDKNLKILKESDLLALLNGKGDYNDNEIDNLIDTEIKTIVDRDPQNAVFVFKENHVEEFVPSKDGLTVEEDELKTNIIESLKKLETENNDSLYLEIPVSRKSADVTTANVNSLGINELVGSGSSTFRGSISARIHNISLASSKFNSILIPPNEVFSFNKTLGDVSTFTGYQQAYVIKDGRTVLGDGGGVCQVSTTLFRAVLNTGLPIVERRSHSYRVGYYEQDAGPGLDATVYDPTTDLKFKNDTPSYLLIQTVFDAKTASLTFNIYGTSDGRVSNITKPAILSSTPPPEDLYVDDPTLPLGEIKQIDYKAWGAKVSFDYQVKKNDEITYEKTFISNYRPWQAVFLRGTKIQ